MQLDAILVPRGAEHRAVSQGLEAIRSVKPAVVAIPAGPGAVTDFLEKAIDPAWRRLWVMGLCGSLKPELGIGRVVVYRACTRSDRSELPCAPEEVDVLQRRLAAPVVLACSTDRVITSAIEKRRLASDLGAQVVDMEGFAILESFKERGGAVGMLRVVSDDCEHDLPNLTDAFDAQGNLQPLPLAFSLLRDPFAGLHLVSGSLRALDTLQTTVRQLFSSAS